ncbi:hypothetical protein [Hymenobacter terrenus]|uniref:hypothetical protein n=1 Tax=Hymenobacter terrenus TaxID=1629124 RepID=UPI00061964E1|nr:hypothetical protein [Hymenobacter terrenus]
MLRLQSVISYRWVRLVITLLLLVGTRAQAQRPNWQTAMLLGGEKSNIHVQATTADANGNVYIAGYFDETARFGSFSLTSAGGSDVFVAKWSAGRFVWAQGAGGAKEDQARAIAVDGTSVYITGDFDSPAALFGTEKLNPNDGSVDVFIAKVTDVGANASFTWAERAGGKAIDRAAGIAVTGANVYVVGNFLSRSADFGSNRLSNAGNGDVFITKLTDVGGKGKFIWAQRAGGSLFDYAAAVVAQGVNVYVAGGFGSGTAAFGSFSLANAVPAGNGVLPDVFVTKLTDVGSSANFAWAQRAGGTGNDAATGIAISGVNVFVTGSFDSPTASFGPITLTSKNLNDVFVAKLLDNDPTFIWALRGGGTGDDAATAIAVNGSNLYLTGTFNSPVADFGRHVLKHDDEGKPKLGDLFVVKLQDGGSSAQFTWAEKAVNTQGLAAAIQGSSIYIAGNTQAPVNFGKQYISAIGGGSGSFLASFTDVVVQPRRPPGSRTRRRGHR